MEPFPEYDDIPWELIASSFQQALSPEETLELETWLSQDPANRPIYEQVEKLWKEGVRGYDRYRRSDRDAGWQSLRETMYERGKPANRKKAAASSPMIKSMRWVAAAIFLGALALGGYLYFFRGPREKIYETAAAESKTASLPDGSFVTLRPDTRVRVAAAYGRSNRLLTLERGEAYFEVLHGNGPVFTVDMDRCSIDDIGTRFTIQRTADSVKVVVFSGSVGFRKHSTGETRVLAAGVAASFRLDTDRFGPTTLTGRIGDSSRNLLQFESAPLPDVLRILQKMTGKEIRMGDSSLASKRLTARLDGESFEDAIRIICVSLDLEQSIKNDTCILKPKLGK